MGAAILLLACARVCAAQEPATPSTAAAAEAALPTAARTAGGNTGALVLPVTGPQAVTAEALDQVKQMLPEVLIRYKGGEIRREDVWPRIESKIKRHLATGNPVPRGMLTFLVGQAMPVLCDVRLLLPEAARKGFVPDLERARKVADELEKARGPDEFARLLQEEGVSREQFVREAAERAAIKDWVDAEFIKSQTATEQEMKTFYEKNPGESSLPERVRLAQIVIRSDAKATPEEKAAAAARIAALREQIKAGTPFADLARTESQAPSATRAGDMGIITKGRIAPPLEAVAFALEPGQVSEVIALPEGFQLLKCEAHEQPLRPPMAEMKDWLVQRTKEDKGSQAFNEYMKKVYADAQMEVLYRKAPGKAPLVQDKATK